MEEGKIKGNIFYLDEYYKEGTYKAYIVFEYSQEVLLRIREGVFVSAQSYSELTQGQNSKRKIRTILSIARVSPLHPAIETLKKENYSVPLRTYLEKIYQDFDLRKSPQNVSILAEAFPVGYSIVEEDGNIDFKPDLSKPVIGSEVRILTRSELEKFINPPDDQNCISVGKFFIPSAFSEQSDYLKRDDIPEIKLRADRLISLHYAIYGSKGTGKSNLSSLLISRLLKLGKINGSEIRIIVFDCSNEYVPLLADHIDDIAYITDVDKKKAREHFKFPLTLEDDEQKMKILEKKISKLKISKVPTIQTINNLASKKYQSEIDLVGWANGERNYGKRLVIVHSEFERLLNVLSHFLSELLISRDEGKGKDTYVLVVIDDAYEFASDISYSEYTKLIEKISRMGRKYKIGICLVFQGLDSISTTRIRANINTFFVGSLRRAYDITEILGLNDVYPVYDIPNKPTGLWLVASSCALARKNIPIQIVAYNRESEINESK